MKFLINSMNVYYKLFRCICKSFMHLKSFKQNTQIQIINIFNIMSLKNLDFWQIRR